MARYRIVRRPSSLYVDAHVYDIEERWLFWWQPVSPSWLSFEQAEQGLEQRRLVDSSKDTRPRVMKEYD
jgi:hypothetical protein